MLNHPRTIANLSRVGKSNGGGALKVEPRALERLEIPADLVAKAGLANYAESGQMSFSP